MQWQDKRNAPEPINHTGISADIMVEYCDKYGEVFVQRGRCFTTYNNGEPSLNYYVYENYTQTNLWILLDIHKVNRWYSLGGVTTINYSNTTLYGFDCKLSSPNLQSCWMKLETLYIKWKDNKRIMKSLGFYHETEGFCIYKDYTQTTYLNINDKALEWTPIEF